MQGQTPVTPLPGSKAGPEAATLLQVVLARIARCLEGPSSPPLICGACKAAGADMFMHARPCQHSGLCKCHMCCLTRADVLHDWHQAA